MPYPEPESAGFPAYKRNLNQKQPFAGRLTAPQAVCPDTESLFAAAASIFGRQRHILVLDELPYVTVTNLTDGVVTLCLRMEGYWYAPPNSHTLQLV